MSDFDANVIQQNRAEYKMGRRDRKEERPNTDNPFKAGDRRVAYFIGWYDEHFFQKYGSPWPEK